MHLSFSRLEAEGQEAKKEHSVVQEAQSLHIFFSMHELLHYFMRRQKKPYKDGIKKIYTKRRVFVWGWGWGAGGGGGGCGCLRRYGCHKKKLGWDLLVSLNKSVGV